MLTNAELSTLNIPSSDLAVCHVNLSEYLLLIALFSTLLVTHPPVSMILFFLCDLLIIDLDNYYILLFGVRTPI